MELELVVVTGSATVEVDDVVALVEVGDVVGTVVDVDVVVLDVLDILERLDFVEETEVEVEAFEDFDELAVKTVVEVDFEETDEVEDFDLEVEELTEGLVEPVVTTVELVEALLVVEVVVVVHGGRLTSFL